MSSNSVDPKLLGERIRTARETIGMYQYVLAEKIGVSQNHINSIESGKSKPSIEVLKDICEVLHVSADYILDLNGGASSQSAYRAAQTLLLKAASLIRYKE